MSHDSNRCDAWGNLTSRGDYLKFGDQVILETGYCKGMEDDEYEMRAGATDHECGDTLRRFFADRR